MALTDGLNHFWDLDDDGVWADDVGGWSLSEDGTPGVLPTGGPDGGGCLNMTFDQNLYRTPVAWDGSVARLTCNMWFKLDAYDTLGNIIFAWRQATRGVIAFNVNATGKLEGSVSDDTTTLSLATSTASISLATWYMATLTDDGTTRRLYVNGSADGTDSTTLSGVYETSATEFSIGDPWSTFAARMDGKAAMFGIWERALSPTEITELYNSGAGKRYVALATAPTGVAYHPLSSRSTHPLRFSI